MIGPATCAFAVVLSWRVTPHAVSDHIVLAGYRVSYPAANLDAVVVLVVALVGLVVAATAVYGAVREVKAAKAFTRRPGARDAVLLGLCADARLGWDPPFLSRQPCIVVLALISAAVALGSVGVAGRLRRHPRVTIR